MSWQYWVLVVGLLASLRPLSELLPLPEPWLRQGWSTVSQMTGQTDPTSSTVPLRQPQEGEQPQLGTQAGTQAEAQPQSRGQSGTQAGTQAGVTKPCTPKALATPEATVDQSRWRPTPDDRLGVLLGKDMVVQLVEPLSPAEGAGLNGGDRLLAVNGKPLRRPSELQAMLSHKPQSVMLTVKRFVVEPGQEQQDVTVKLLPDPLPQP